MADFLRITDTIFEGLSLSDTPKGADGPVTFGLRNADARLSAFAVMTSEGRDDLLEMAEGMVDVYIVRQGPQMAALGIALIKEAFSEGLSEELHEDYGEQVRDLIGRRMLTKVDEPDFVLAFDGSVNDIKVDGVVVCRAKKVRTYYGTKGDVVTFEEKRVLGNGMVEAFDGCNTDFFTRRLFAKRCYLGERVRPADKDQIINYLKLKRDYESTL